MRKMCEIAALWPRIGVVIFALMPDVGHASCRQALALGLDISGSVDAAEYRLQMDGLANALLDADVQAAFLAIPGAEVRLFIYEWGGFGTQRVLVQWTDITDAQVLASIADILHSTKRLPHDPATAIGKAMLFGAEALVDQGDCWRMTLDLSGDGKSNIGPLPAQSKRQPLLADITVNALVIGVNTLPFSQRPSNESVDLVRYFVSQVIRGPNAFVESAEVFEDFQAAMARKLLKELETRAVGALELPDQ
ncbi:MAG: DUF1194 domain-containing protein [Paracoccaceae bacterium]